MKSKHNFVIALLIVALCSASISFHCNHKRWAQWRSEMQRRSEIARSRLLGLRALTIVKCFTVKDAVGKNMIRVGRDYDGGYVMVDDFSECEAAYSFGISDDVSWDLDISKKGIDVFMYDHTIKSLPIQNPRFHFFKTGICGVPYKEKNLKTFEEILTENGHIANKNLILKIDVEGAEWDAFDKTPSEIIDNFSQIVAEFHDTNAVANTINFNKILGVLEKLNLTHQVVHVHANNYGMLNIVGGVPFTRIYEITYLRKRDNKFSNSTKCFPINGLDMPNNPQEADFFLGFLGVFDKV